MTKTERVKLLTVAAGPATMSRGVLIVMIHMYDHLVVRTIQARILYVSINRGIDIVHTKL